MVSIPDVERTRFDSLLIGEANRIGLGVDEYLRKVWYHQQAAQLGEYVAMALLAQLLEIAPSNAAMGAQPAMPHSS